MKKIYIFTPLIIFLGLYLVPLINGEFYAGEDILNLHLPFRAIYETSIRNGELPLWSKHMFNGYRLYAEGEIGGVHPLHVILHLYFRVGTVLLFEFIFIYSFAYIGSLLLSKIFTQNKIYQTLFASLVLTSPFFIGQYVHINMIIIWAHLPWILWANYKIITEKEKKQRVKFSLVTSIMITSQMLLGQQQAFILCCWVWIPLTLYAIHYFKKPFFKTSMYGVSAVILAAVLSAVQWLPTLDFLAEGQRLGHTKDYVNEYTAPIKNLLQWFIPIYHEKIAILPNERIPNYHEFLFWLPSPVIIITAYSIINYRQLPEKWIKALVIFSSFILIIMLGKYGYLNSIFNYIPILKHFRVPPRYFSVLQFLLSILFVTMLIKGTVKKEIIGLKRLTQIFICCTLTILIYFIINQEYSVSIPILIFSLVLTLFPIIPFLNTKLNEKNKAVICFTTIAVSILFSSSIFERLRGKASLEFYNNNFVKHNQLHKYRYLADGKNYWRHSKGEIWGYGYGAIIPYDRSFNSMKECKLYSVNKLYREHKVDYYQKSIPRFALFPEQSQDSLTIESNYLSPNENKNFEVFIDTNLNQKIKVNIPQKSLLVVSDRWHKNWFVTVNGKQKKIIKIDPRRRGLELKAGKNNIHFYYHSNIFIIGKYISYIGIIFVLMIVIWLFLQKER